MLIDCKKPPFSTPDVFEIYSNFQTYSDSVTGSPMETTELSTTELLTTDIITYSPIDQSSNFEMLGCQFHENDHGATFDTGSPYSNNMRQGLRNSQLSSAEASFFMNFSIILG